MVGNIPKYRTLVNWVKEKIRHQELVPGDKLQSEHELSARFQVSRQTVRHALAILEKDGMIEKRQGSGNYVSGFLLDKKEKDRMNITIISTYINAYIFPEIIEGMERVLTDEEYNIQIVFTHNKVELERDIIKKILNGNVADGLIIEPTKSGIPNPNKYLYDEIIKKRIPAVFFNSHYPGIRLPYVALDDEKAGYMAAMHLIEAGHKKIAGIFKCDDGQGHKRYAGYINALIDAGIKLRDENVLWLDTEDQKYFSGDDRRVLRRIKSCTACVCYNDTVAHDLEILLIKHAIKIPDQMSIVSIDNSELAELCEVPLTSVAHPMKRLGEKAAGNLIEKIKNHHFEGTYLFEPTLVERESVKKADPVHQ